MLTELSCKAEIAQFNDASFGDENIFRLHVSMNTLGLYCLERLDSKRVQNLVMLSSAIEFFQIFKVVT